MSKTWNLIILHNDFLRDLAGVFAKSVGSGSDYGSFVHLDRISALHSNHHVSAENQQKIGCNVPQCEERGIEAVLQTDSNYKRSHDKPQCQREFYSKHFVCRICRRNFLHLIVAFGRNSKRRYTSLLFQEKNLVVTGTIFISDQYHYH